jgi:hypothetical protein
MEPLLVVLQLVAQVAQELLLAITMLLLVLRQLKLELQQGILLEELLAQGELEEAMLPRHLLEPLEVPHKTV